MNLDQLLAIETALVTAEHRLLATNKDRPIEPIKQILDEIKEAQQIVKQQILSHKNSLAG
ncbi:MAG: hypothetical protein ACOH5I_15595 [Oligoflexus sp.]